MNFSHVQIFVVFEDFVTKWKLCQLGDCFITFVHFEWLNSDKSCRCNSEEHCVFHQLRVDQQISDVTLVCEDTQQINVHNVILSTEINLFKKMLT